MTTKLIVVLGGPNDGRTFPWTRLGLQDAMAAGGSKVRPARRISAPIDDSQDYDDYGLDIDRGNSEAYVSGCWPLTN